MVHNYTSCKSADHFRRHVEHTKRDNKDICFQALPAPNDILNTLECCMGHFPNLNNTTRFFQIDDMPFDIWKIFRLCATANERTISIGIIWLANFLDVSLDDIVVLHMN